MSDERTRDLERRAQDDPTAAASLARARCRAEGHTPQEGTLRMRYDARKFAETGSLEGAKSFQPCSRCGDEIPYEGTIVASVRGGACPSCGGAGILPGVVNERCPQCNPMPAHDDDDDDESGGVRAAVARRRASPVRAAHKAAGLCDMHNGVRYCGLAGQHVIDDLRAGQWPLRHKFDGPPIG